MPETPPRIAPGQRQAYVWPPWHESLAPYAAPRLRVSLWQLANTLLPYAALWYGMVLSLRAGLPLVTLALGVAASAFLVRIFILFHDCTHDSFFTSRGANTFAGYLLGTLVFTPYADWRFSHLRHHATYANLELRGYGDIWTMTVAEYRAAPPLKRFGYRLFRNPWIMFGLGALFSFLLRFRLPLRKTGRREKFSILLTNLLLAGIVTLATLTIGWRTYLLIQIPVLWLAGTAGIWLFYVQHQFKGVYWAHQSEWDPLRAAMEGSSFYRLPAPLRWFSANIGYHYIHHLNARIPNYRLKACYDGIPELRERPPLTPRASLEAIPMKLWDEDRRELVGFPPAIRSPLRVRS